MKVAQSGLTLLPIEFSTPEYCLSFSRGSSQPRDQTQICPIAGDSLPAEPQRKPKNTGVGSLSLLQRIFLTQESNWSLLNCRQILYQMNYETFRWQVNICLNFTEWLDLRVLVVQSLSRVALLRLHGLEPTSLLCPLDFPDKNTEVGCHFLFQDLRVNAFICIYII